MKRFSLINILVFSFLYLIISCSNQSSFLSEDITLTVADTESLVDLTDSLQADDADVALDVIILAGQSNATGISYTEELKDYISSDLYDLFSAGCDNVYITGYTDWSVIDLDANIIDLQKVKFGFGAYSYHFGLEIGLSYVFNTSGKKTLIIKYTSPGNYIDYFLNDDKISTHFESFINSSLSKLETLGFIPTIKALCWMQGENESMLYDRAIKYEQKEKYLINDIRKKYGENIVFIDARVTDWDLVQSINFQSVVNEAKVNISLLDTRNFLVDSSGLTKSQKDTLHYDARSEYELGVRMGKILQGIME